VRKTKDLQWKPGLSVNEFMDQMGAVGYQSIQLGRAAKCIAKMKRDGAKIILTFTSNMVTSGLRGFFAQLIHLGMVDSIVTTVGGIEEDMIKASGEQFILGSFYADDVKLREQGLNRIGNILVSNQQYEKFEADLMPMLADVYKKKARLTPSELFKIIGSKLDDKNSILCQAAKHNVPIFCPAITDGSFGFHLYMFQQKHPDFIIDVIQDFKKIVLSMSHDEKKGIIALGGSISKHHAILAALINGGADYAVYMTTARPGSGSMSSATTQEAKSWGKIKDDSDAVTVNGDVTVMFPLAMMQALEELQKDDLLNSR
jgi:deoxyhypusine synthase